VVAAALKKKVLLGIGWGAYGAHVPGRTALALVVTVVIGAASFCCLGYAAQRRPFTCPECGAAVDTG
jgi:ABC-2 type transport system permease protein